MNNSEKDFLGEVKKHLDQSTDNLDAASRSRLNSIRNQALEQAHARKRPLRPWLWAGGVALPALALTLLVFFGLPNQQTIDSQAPRVAIVQPVEEPPVNIATLNGLPQNMEPDDLEILLAEEDLDMLADLDFLNWLDSMDEAGG